MRKALSSKLSKSSSSKAVAKKEAEPKAAPSRKPQGKVSFAANVGAEAELAVRWVEPAAERAASPALSSSPGRSSSPALSSSPDKAEEEEEYSYTYLEEEPPVPADAPDDALAPFPGESPLTPEPAVHDAGLAATPQQTPELFSPRAPETDESTYVAPSSVVKT